LKTKSVCLIVDNPLRDLNGLILLAYQLVKRGMDVWLVPMYEQWKEIQAIRPDAVMVNYLRENNRNHVISYLRAGMMVGVLETEGVGGRSLNEYRQLVSTTGCADLLDLYCLWGSSQKTTLLEEGVISESIAKVTGCPRYDFCAPPWRHMLERRESRPYVLINTSFPTVNPQFSAGKGAEIAAMVAAGFSAEFAAEYIDAARRALTGMVGLLEELAVKFPDKLFVLRPHPFELPEGYQSLRRFPNLEIRQEGTSLEWVAHADALIHLNCSTAVEASMLGVPTLSPMWLDATPLHVPLASDLSRHFNSLQELAEGLSLALAGLRLLPLMAYGLADRRRVVGKCEVVCWTRWCLGLVVWDFV
jgi:surface carbohydrate biosynthesis protein